MEMTEIIKQVNRLYDNYNADTHQEIRGAKIEFLNRELSKYNTKAFVIACDSILADENIKKFPSLSQIKNYIPKGDSKEIQEFCDKCERTGYYNQWQWREQLNKYYDFTYRCHCNHTIMLNIPVLASEMIPIRAHNPFPPSDPKHEDFNNQKKPWDYQRLDKETFQVLAYSHKMKSVLKSVN